MANDKDIEKRSEEYLKEERERERERFKLIAKGSFQQLNYECAGSPRCR